MRKMAVFHLCLLVIADPLLQFSLPIHLQRRQSLVRIFRGLREIGVDPQFPCRQDKLLEQLVIAGKLQVTLIPQGTLAERIRAGGAGIPAFYTPAGFGTVVAEGKESREFDGKHYIMERWLKADFALIKAWKGDRHGNLVYRKTARNFNPMMATAARITIAEVEELVEPGDLPPDSIMTPGIYVNRILKGEQYQHRIERLTVSRMHGSGRVTGDKPGHPPTPPDVRFSASGD